MLRRILTVAGRELRSYFDHATAYILLVVFLAVSFFFFFRDAYLLGEASLRPMFGLLPWLLLFFVPAVAMRALAEERRSGTLELVLAQPLGEAELLVGKFLGVLGFLAVALAGTLGAPLGLSLGGDLQWGVVAAQYAGSLLLAAGLVSIGLWASSTTSNQVTAFIAGVATVFLFYLLSLPAVALSLPGPLAAAAMRLGILGHFENIARGVIDLRDVLYFVALAAAFLALSYYSLLREKLSRRRPAYRRLRAGTAGLVGIALLAGLLGGELRGRLDLTPGKAFTLSGATRSLLRGLEDVVTVKWFTSRDLPPEFAFVQRDIEDLLRDFEAAGGANLRAVRRFPAADEGAREEATRLGIPPIQFNVMGEEEFQVKQGYLGLAVQYAGEVETLPVVQRTADLEYRLVAAIRALTRETRPTVAFLQGHGEEGPATLRRAGARLREEYEVETFHFDSLATEVPGTVDVLVVAGPRSPIPDEAAEALGRHLERGGSLLLLVAGMEVDQRTRFSMPTAQPALDSLLARHGVRLARGLAFDLRLNARLPVRGDAGITYVLPYPLWPLVRPASEHIAVQELSSVLLPWPSPLEIEDPEAAEVIPLLATSEFGGRISTPTSVDPARDWSELAASEPGHQVVAAALLPRPGARGGGQGGAAEGDGRGSAAEGDAPAARRGGGRIILVGTAEFIADDFLGGTGDNLQFFQNALDWLAQDEALISIRSRDRSPPRLLFPSALARDGVKYGNLVGVPLLFVLFGILRLARRRRLQGTSSPRRR